MSREKELDVTDRDNVDVEIETRLFDNWLDIWGKRG